MVATHNSSKENPSANTAAETIIAANESTALSKSHAHTLNSATTLLLPSRIVTHSAKAGLNPLADAASYIFSVLGKLRQMQSYRQLSKLQTELIQEVNLFQETIRSDAHNAEYILVCRYIVCAVIDDILSNTTWGSQGQWQSYSLLAAFNQDTQHEDKFFSIMERAIKDPAQYIDLMELMYICLSMGYKGQYRSTEHSQYQLEQITNSLYKHIRAYRGSFSKTLSPTPLKPHKTMMRPTERQHSSLPFIICVTACIIMTIFIGLGYLMDVISNEAYKNISQIENSVSHETSNQ